MYENYPLWEGDFQRAIAIFHLDDHKKVRADGTQGLQNGLMKVLDLRGALEVRGKVVAQCLWHTNRF